MQAYGGAQSYLKTQVESSTPLERVALLYAGALQAMAAASEAMAKRDLPARRTAMNRAMGILAELQKPDQIALNDDASNSRIEKCNQYAAQVAQESGVTGGTDTVRDDDPNLVGVSDENRYSDAARVAYRDCMLGIQHDS